MELLNIKIVAVDRKGFTLVELLVSIAIMATLMSILLPNFMGAREKAQDSQKIQDIGALKNGLRLYYNDHQAYPTGVTGGGPLSSTFTTYVSSVGSTAYNYYSTGNGDGFILCVNLSSGAGTGDTESQLKCGLNNSPTYTPVPNNICGLGIGATGEKVFTVCAR